VRSPPEGLREQDLVRALADGWGVVVESVRYVPVGFGSYHWDLRDAAGGRYFGTVDDLDVKGWLGDDRDSTFEGLRVAFDTALALRRDGGLRFVVAPVPAADDRTVLRLDSRYSVALFPFVEGSGRLWGEERPPGEWSELVHLLADLHGATRAAPPSARRRYMDLPRRRRLEAALRELDRPWTGGPFSEPLRALLTAHAAALLRRLETLDRLASDVAMSDGDFVVTHGEPHGGNVLRAAGGLTLVDWDTVGLAPPERDLWMIADDPARLAQYADFTGRPVDPTAIALYRLRWELDDVSSFSSVLRSAHTRTADTEKAWDGLMHYLRSEDG
jgi:spectinomycin phosphotransferase